MYIFSISHVYKPYIIGAPLANPPTSALTS